MFLSEIKNLNFFKLIFSVLEEFDASTLGAAEQTDIRLIQSEKERLQENYQREVDLFIAHLR